MAATIPTTIFGFTGQCVKSLVWESSNGHWVIHCDRDRRYKAVDHRSGVRGTVNRRLRRQILDLPLFGRPVRLSFAYCQLKVGASDRRMERLSFVDPGQGFTRRFARFVSQLCRHMSIAAVAHCTGLAWRTVKAMDQRSLKADFPALRPQDITGVRYLGVDEVARAKDQDYLTVVYDLDTGTLLWVAEGRTQAGLQAFSNQMETETSDHIQAVAMDIWPRSPGL